MTATWRITVKRIWSTILSIELCKKLQSHHIAQWVAMTCMGQSHSSNRLPVFEGALELKA